MHVRHEHWPSQREDLEVWRRTERGLQVAEEESMVLLTIKVSDKHTGPSGLGDLEVTECISKHTP